MTLSYEKAFEWYAKAADQGHKEAQYNLGFMYYCGRGVTQDHNKAAEFFAEAAKQGQADAQYKQGHLYDLAWQPFHTTRMLSYHSGQPLCLVDT